MSVSKITTAASLDDLSRKLDENRAALTAVEEEFTLMRNKGWQMEMTPGIILRLWIEARTVQHNFGILTLSMFNSEIIASAEDRVHVKIAQLIKSGRQRSANVVETIHTHLSTVAEIEVEKAKDSRRYSVANIMSAVSAHLSFTGVSSRWSYLFHGRQFVDLDGTIMPDEKGHISIPIHTYTGSPELYAEAVRKIETMSHPTYDLFFLVTLHGAMMQTENPYDYARAGVVRDGEDEENLISPQTIGLDDLLAKPVMPVSRSTGNYPHAGPRVATYQTTEPVTIAFEFVRHDYRPYEHNRKQLFGDFELRAYRYHESDGIILPNLNQNYLAHCKGEYSFKDMLMRVGFLIDKRGRSRGTPDSQSTFENPRGRRRSTEY